jgi:hypothetical protein
MATVNFSVPEDVKNAFNKAFAGRNKSAVIAELMREAVSRLETLEQRRLAVRRIRARRQGRRPVRDRELRRAREGGRA